MTETELVIYSSAIKAGNVAYDAARKLGLPTVRRADALAAIMNCQEGHRDLRHARQDDDVVDGGPCAQKLRPESVALRRRGDSDPRNERALGRARASTSSRKATRATARSSFIIPNTPSSSTSRRSTSTSTRTSPRSMPSMPSSSARRGEKSSTAPTTPGRRASVLRIPARSATAARSNRYRFDDIARKTSDPTSASCAMATLLGASLNIPGLHNAVIRWR